MLKLECLPKNDKHDGIKVEVKSNVIEEGPGTCLFEVRHEFTKFKLSGDRFRIMSYNILADVYSNTEYSKEVLFAYCPSFALDMEYRKHLIQKEIIGFNADVICLQEVDTKVYQTHLMPVLSTLNYNSEYTAKNQLQEGLSIFFNKERFKKLNFEYSVISEGLQLEEFSNVLSKIKNENVKNRLLTKSTIIQGLTLQSKENLSEILVVGNTHLYFKPDAQHIRLLQTYYAVMYLDNLAKKAKTKHPECNVNILFCGDFNATPACGAYRLINEKYVSEKCSDWCSNPNEIVEDLSLTHQVNLSSAYGTPEYTNYTPTFMACLDYIFYQKDNLEVIQTVPIPSKEEVSLHEGLPSIVCPSDHISLCADMKWSNK
ncbi:hypothetical protein KM043_015487 [Ampulex compressa]|nr:hypothetical protein KM043_015487 [Ampulex compressa]